MLYLYCILIFSWLLDHLDACTLAHHLIQQGLPSVGNVAPAIHPLANEVLYLLAELFEL